MASRVSPVAWVVWVLEFQLAWKWQKETFKRQIKIIISWSFITVQHSYVWKVIIGVVIGWGLMHHQVRSREVKGKFETLWDNESSVFLCETPIRQICKKNQESWLKFYETQVFWKTIHHYPNNVLEIFCLYLSTKGGGGREKTK